MYRTELFKGLKDETSQLNMIFSAIGNPSEEDFTNLDATTAHALRQAPIHSEPVRLLMAFYMTFANKLLLFFCFISFCWKDYSLLPSTLQLWIY